MAPRKKFQKKRAQKRREAVPVPGSRDWGDSIMINEFRVGEVFAKSLSILFANFLSFMTIALVVHLPVILLSLASVDSANPTAPGETSGTELLTRVLEIVLGPIATGAITFGVLQQLRGQHAPMGTCVSTGFSRMFAVLRVAINVGLWMGVAFILLIIPGFIVMTMLWVAIPVAVVERVGVRDSLGRSQELTKGNRMKIFGLFLLVTIIAILVAFVVGAMLAFAANPIVMAVCLMLLGIFFSAWQASAQAVSYYYLRSMKETIDIDGIASVFD